MTKPLNEIRALKTENAEKPPILAILEGDEAKIVQGHGLLPLAAEAD
ncbi:hypothetical protein [Paenibacillus sp. GbtcB18]|nr:hypothetical protein [Paenibacillus sp. GbtcB18]